MYSPVLYPAFSRIYAVLTATDPFPFVPVICIDLKDFCGLSSLSASFLKVSIYLTIVFLALFASNNIFIAYLSMKR